MNAQLDPRFGRCAYFLIVNPDDMSFEAFENESAAGGRGAGIQSAQFLASKGVDAVITGNCDPNAMQTLSAAEIEVFGGQTGIVREVVGRFFKGNLRPTSDATVDGHFGMTAEGGFNRRRGMSRSTGDSRGMDRGIGMTGWHTSKRTAGVTGFKDQGLEGLKQQARALNKIMKEVIERTNKVEKSD